MVTVETTQPLTPFDYALKIAETWKPGAKGKDNGVVFLVVSKDHKMFVTTGYGVEGMLPDGKVGAIQDQYIVPAFKQGNYSQGILAGTQAMAAEIAQGYGVTLTGVPAPRQSGQGRPDRPASPLPSVHLSLHYSFVFCPRQSWTTITATAEGFTTMVAMAAGGLATVDLAVVVADLVASVVVVAITGVGAVDLVGSAVGILVVVEQDGIGNNT